MTRNEVDEYTSESLGFRLSTTKAGIRLFPGSVDFDSPPLQSAALQLLHAGNKHKLYAASNTQHVGVGLLDSLENESSALQSFKTVALKDVTYLRLNSTDDVLFAISEGTVYKAAVSAILAQSPSAFEEYTTESDVLAIEPSPYAANALCFLDAAHVLHIDNRGAKAEVQGVNYMAWNHSSPDIVAVSDDGLKFLSLEGEEKTSYQVEEGGRLYYVAAVDSNNWYLVGTPEDDMDDDIHTLISLHDGNYTCQTLPVAPPFGEASRAPTIYSAHISNWKEYSTFLFFLTGLSTEISTLECGEQQQLITQAEDTNRAELPMDDDTGDDTFPVGLMLDISGTSRTVNAPSPSLDDVTGILPRLFCLNNLGHLLSWDIFDIDGVKNNSLSLVRAQQHDELTYTEESEQQIFNEEESSNPEFANPPIVSSEFAKSLDTDALSLHKPDEMEAKATSFFASPPNHNSKNELQNSSEVVSKDLNKTVPVETSSNPPAKTSAFGTATFGSAKSVGGLAFGSTGFGGNSSAGSTFGSTSFAAPSSGGFGSGEPKFGRTSFGSEPGPASDSSSLQASKGSTFASYATKTGMSDTASPFAKLTASSDNGIFGGSSFSGAAVSDTASPFAKLTASSNNGIFGGSSFSGAAVSDTASPFAKLTTSSNNGIFGVSSSSGAAVSDTASPFAKSDTNTAKPMFGNLTPSEPKESLLPKSNIEEIQPQIISSESFSQEYPHKDLGSTSNPQKVVSYSKDLNLDSLTEGLNTSDIDLNHEFTHDGLQANSEISIAVESDIDSEDFQDRVSYTEQETDSISTQSKKNSGSESMNKNIATVSSTANKDLGPRELGEEIQEPKAKEANDEKMRLTESKTEEQKDDALIEEEIKDIFPQSIATNDELETDSLKVESEFKTDHTTLSGSSTPQETNESDSVISQEPVIIVNKYEGSDILELVRDMEFCRLSGFTESPTKLPEDGPIAAKIRELVQRTQGDIDILEMNSASASSLMEAAGWEMESSDLSNSENWTLGNVNDLMEPVSGLREKLKSLLSEGRQQDARLEQLLKQLAETEQKSDDIKRLITQLFLFAQNAHSSDDENRPLDVRAEILRTKLRKKLAKVENLLEELSQRLLPLGIRMAVKCDGTARLGKLERITYELDTKTREYDRYSREIEHKVNYYCTLHQNESEGKKLLEFGTPSVESKSKDKIKLAGLFSKSGTPRKVEFSN